MKNQDKITKKTRTCAKINIRIMCTGIRFTDTAGEMYFGRNLDWSTGYGEKIVITPHGYRYLSAYLGENTNNHAIIGMGIIAENTPLYFDCANDAGLAIAGLNFPGYAKYEPAPVNGKINIAAYEFPLWVARNFTSIDSLMRALPNVAIISKPINDKYPVSELHWLIGDKSRSIVVEYTSRGLEIHDNPPDILTNQPDYNWHHENLRNYMNLFPITPKGVKWRTTIMHPFGTGSLMQGLPGGYSPTDRFIRAAYLNTHYPAKSTEKENISRLFHTLSGVSMIDGAAAMQDGSFEKTIYTGGYSTKTKTYYYNTYDDFTIKSVKLSDYNLDSNELIQV